MTSTGSSSVDGTLSYYLLPSDVVAGRFVISLAAYEQYRLKRVAFEG